jgi:ankyrin repeat protein
MRNDKDRTPLHLLFDHANPCPEALALLLKHSSSLAKAGDVFGDTPLHILCDRARPNTTLLSTLCSGNKDCAEAIHTTNKSGKLPLHVLLDRPDPCVHAMLVLLSYCPKALQYEALFGLPLHLLAAHPKQCLATLKRVAEAFPDALRTQNTQGDTPLHRLCAVRGASTRCVRYLLSTFPGAACLRNTEGLTPLHVCVRNKEPRKPIVKLLLDASPDTARWPMPIIPSGGAGRPRGKENTTVFPAEYIEGHCVSKHKRALVTCLKAAQQSAVEQAYYALLRLIVEKKKGARLFF